MKAMKTIRLLLACLCFSCAVVLTPRAAELPAFALSVTAKPASTLWLGLGLGEVTPLTRIQFGLPEGVGIAVEQVAKGSPADKAGLKTHDILTRLDDQLLLSPQQLQQLVRHKKEGDPVTLTFVRQGKEQKLTATLAKAPADMADSSDPRREGLIQGWREHLPENWPGLKTPLPSPKGDRPKEGLEFKLEKLLPRIEVKPGEGGKFFNYRIQTSREKSHSLQDPDGAFALTVKEGRKHFRPEDKSGKVTFDGDVTDEAARAKVHAAAVAKLKLLEEMFREGRPKTARHLARALRQANQTREGREGLIRG